MGGFGYVIDEKKVIVTVETEHLTSELMWHVTLTTALIDSPILILVARYVSSELFGKLKWYLAGTAVLLYAVIWGTVGSLYFWDTVYKAIFPAWSRWLLPVGFGLLYGALALVFWQTSILATKGQAVWFILLGGIISLVGHSIGVSRGLFRVSLLADVSIASAFAFGVFEFIFYWCMIVGLSITLRWLGLRLRKMYGK